MSSSLTSKGKEWESKNSRWILWTVLSMGFLNYVSFFYISKKVEQKKWFYSALVYLAIFVMFMLAVEFMLVPDFFTSIFLISWFVSIFHVYKVKTEYLLRLEAMEAAGIKDRKIVMLKEKIAKEYETQDPNYKMYKTREEERVEDNSYVVSPELEKKLRKSPPNERNNSKRF